MKIRVLRKDLINHLNLANITSSWNEKLNIPIIRNLLINAEGNTISFKTISSGVCKCISRIKSIDLIEPGNVLVNPKNLLEIIQKSSDSLIFLEKIDNSILRISYTGYETNLNILEWEQFPDFYINLKNNNNNINLFKEDILFINKKIIFNSLIESSFQQQIHESIQIDTISNSNKMFFSFTNSIQLITWNKKFKGEQFKFCIHKDVFKNLESLFKIEEDINFFYSNRKLYAVSELITIEIIDWEDVIGLSKFGDISKIIRDESLLYIWIEKKLLINALEKSMIFRNSNSKVIKLVIEKDKIIIKSNSEEIGNSKEEIKIKSKNVEDGFECSIDANYLLSLIKNLDSNEIEIGFGGLRMDVRIDPIIIKDESIKNYIQMMALSIS